MQVTLHYLLGGRTILPLWWLVVIVDDRHLIIRLHCEIGKLVTRAQAPSVSEWRLFSKLLTINDLSSAIRNDQLGCSESSLAATNQLCHRQIVCSRMSHTQTISLSPSGVLTVI